jgi:hypothetical protein
MHSRKKKRCIRNRKNKKPNTRKNRVRRIQSLGGGRGVGRNSSSGGVFCYMPYNSLDKQNKSTFKIESGVNILEQIKKLKIFFPQGFFVIAMLKSPKIGIKEIRNNETYYKLIMDKIIEITIDNGGISDPTNDNGWVNSTIDIIHNAFRTAEEMYGGECLEYGLTGKINDTMNLIDVKNTEKPVYVGKVIFHT